MEINVVVVEGLSNGLEFLVSYGEEVICVFTVIEKNATEYGKNLKTDISKLVKVYAVRDDKNGYPQFLIYENGEWKYRSAKYYCEVR